MARPFLFYFFFKDQSKSSNALTLRTLCLLVPFEMLVLANFAVKKDF
jgi:hypothetical protein